LDKNVSKTMQAQKPNSYINKDLNRIYLKGSMQKGTGESGSVTFTVNNQGAGL
jgi:hypothetical protein